MADEQTTTTEGQTTQTQATETSLANTNQQTTDSTKTNNDTSLANTKPEDKPAPAKAPEKYEPFKAPEGFEFSPDSLAKATPLFKELGLTQDSTQKLMDLYASEAQALANGPVEHWQNMQKEWKDSITKDPTYGNGNGGLKPEVTKAISDVKNLLPADVKASFEEAMDLTGAGNHPAFIKTLHFLASKLTEGAHVAGKGPSPHGQTAPGKPGGPGPGAMYPTLQSGASS